MNQIEIEKNKVNFKYLWKIKEIDVNIISFTKHLISAPVDSLETPNNVIITLKETMGTETHKVTPDVQLELSGKVGEIIKGFQSDKLNNNVKVKKIIWL